MLGLWLALPIPMGTEFEVKKDTYVVVGIIKAPPKNDLPTRAYVEHRVRDGGRFTEWVWKEHFDDCGVDRFYIVEINGKLSYYAGWQVQLLRLK